MDVMEQAIRVDHWRRGRGDGRPPYDYNRFVERIQEHFVEQEVPFPRWREVLGHPEVKVAFQANILRAMKALHLPVEERDRQEVARELAEWMIGVGVLQPFLEMEGIEEIIVRKGHVYIEREGQLQEIGDLATDKYFEQLVRRIADQEGKVFGAQQPQIKIGLPDGSRLTAVIAPMSVAGTAINIRRFSRHRMSFDDLIEFGSADRETAQFLAEVAEEMKKSVVFAGPPGAGKTTWLNAFSRYLPPGAQVSTVETFQELQLQVPYPNRLIVPEDPQAMGDAINLVILRMRPDVLIVGEVVSREAVEYIMALNLGIVSHTTTHSNDARGALFRLESLSREAAIGAKERREILGTGLGLVVYLEKEFLPRERRWKRYMGELLAVKGVKQYGESVEYDTVSLKRWTGDGWTPLKAGKEVWRT